MKMIMTLISRMQIDGLSGWLSTLGICGMTMTEVKCPISKNNISRGMKEPRYIPKIKVEIVISDDKVDQLISRLSSDEENSFGIVDKICVLDINQCVRIRTGDTGEESLQ